jgi:hypothetical protein
MFDYKYDALDGEIGNYLQDEVSVINDTPSKIHSPSPPGGGGFLTTVADGRWSMYLIAMRSGRSHM